MSNDRVAVATGRRLVKSLQRWGQRQEGGRVRTNKTQTDDYNRDVASNGEYSARKVPLHHYKTTA